MSCCHDMHVWVYHAPLHSRSCCAGKSVVRHMWHSMPYSCYRIYTVQVEDDKLVCNSGQRCDVVHVHVRLVLVCVYNTTKHCMADMQAQQALGLFTCLTVITSELMPTDTSRGSAMTPTGLRNTPLPYSPYQHSQSSRFNHRI